MKWEKSIRKENEPFVLETVFVCRKFGQYEKANYLGYGVYRICNEDVVFDHENPVVEFMSINPPKRLK